MQYTALPQRISQNTTVQAPVVQGIPGYLCPTCKANGIETVCINGTTCPVCKTEIDVNKPKMRE
ncbi:hypothetical protein H072_9029 [Dactylellina haptotyla CBS 200.50]|uniref:Uncharacterized protein n=1 Tax=Dactylellina haptotyla (strain CBS 200.50) TaxID=1284197 RepID=S8A847_DACHA|nr:hypothetical protein H072_9029 [Dactylellina haptotyla CBS 200.50]